MLNNYLSKTSPSHIVMVIFLGLLYFILIVSVYLNTPFSLLNLGKSSLYLIPFLVFSLLAEFTVQNQKLTKKNSFVLFTTAVLLGTFPITLFATQTLLAACFLVLSFRKTLQLKENTKTIATLFDSAFWVGVATIFFNWSLLFFTPIYVALFLYHKSTHRNLLIPIVGVFTPLFLLFTFYFFTDALDEFEYIFRFQIDFDYTTYSNIKLLFPLLILIVLTLLATLWVTQKKKSVSDAFNQRWTLTIVLLIMAITVVILAPAQNGSSLIFGIFPAAIVIGNYLQIIRRQWIKEGVLWLLLGTSFVIYFL